MTTQETIKPLVDRILSNPLHFKKAHVRTDQRDVQEGPYVVIGKQDELASQEASVGGDPGGVEPGSGGSGGLVGTGRPVVPRSVAEAVSLYARARDESLSDVDVNAASAASSGTEDQQFHEASEYAEDVGTALSSDEPFQSDQESSSGESLSDSLSDVSKVSDSERIQLQQEALEASVASRDAEDELKHKAPLAQRSMTPPTMTGDIGNFYQLNENQHDTGSSSTGRVVKNWGPHLAVLRPRGLLNHGVTCYTNAAVQAMIHIPAVQHYLFDILRGNYESTISRDSVSYVLAETSRKMWLPQDKSKKKPAASHVNPKKLIARLHDVNCMMSEWQQEDSHEYFMSLMSRLQEDSVPRGHKMTESIIYDIFGGLLKQVVTCKSCGGVSKTEQPFYDLSLHLKGRKKPSSQPDSAGSDVAKDQSGKTESNGKDLTVASKRFSIEKAIKDFFTPELIRVDKEQKGYVCEKCHKTTNATKHSSIMRAPETLLIHLKKFRFNGTSSSKMKQAVSYPMFLDMTEFCEPDEKNHVVPVKYQLTTVVVHEGRSLSSGHYIVHCRQPDGSWAIYDDEYLNKITERDVLKEPNAYYLLYTRLTPKEVKNTHKLNVNDLTIPSQVTGSSSNNNTPSSSPISNNRSKKWKKNKKRRFNRY